MLRRNFFVPFGLAGLLASAACAPRVEPGTPNSTSAAQVRNSVSDRLYFGREIPGGGNVTDENWNTFLAEVVTPRFPSGFTAWRAQGQWRNAAGAIVREDTFILEFIHADDPHSESMVREIIAEYKNRFRQEAVMRVRDRVEAQF